MKLIWRIVLHFSWVLSLLMIIWAVIFYFVLVGEINDETDDALEDYAELIEERHYSASGHELYETGENNSWYINEVSEEYALVHPHETFTDEYVYIPHQGEEEHARVLRKIFLNDEGKYMELTVLTPTFEKDDFREAMLTWIIILYAVLMLCVLTINLIVLHHNLKPLYTLLEWLDNYNVGAQDNPELKNDTDIREFRQLGDAAIHYARRAEARLAIQKQFIGNAAHELQTPVAVCKNRLEMLMDDEERPMSEEQMGEILKVYRTLDQMSRLNKSLLLLFKIDNGQFNDVHNVEFNPIVTNIADDLSEIYHNTGILVNVHESGILQYRMDGSLASMLVSNLIRNAFIHGIQGSEIVIDIKQNELSISNPGKEALDKNLIFRRFYHRDNASSSGLGLAIVEAICNQCRLRIDYRFEEGKHVFRIVFR